MTQHYFFLEEGCSSMAPDAAALAECLSTFTKAEQAAGRLGDKWPEEFAGMLEQASWRPPEEFLTFVPLSFVRWVLSQALRVLHEPPVVDIPRDERKLVVVGDTHGQLHDVLTILREYGPPREGQTLIFNGDFVDRGNWGVEVFLLLLAWKIARPSAIYLTRGNHETHFPQASYGFKGEIAAKLGSNEAEGVSEEPIGCWRLFCDICMALPLAIIGGRNSGGGVVVLHGGIPRSPSLQKTRSKKRKRRPKFASLDDIHDAAEVTGRGGDNPMGQGPSQILSDVLWSDPTVTTGSSANEERGLGARFGPDVTSGFLRSSGCTLLVRSHEGPEARLSRIEYCQALEMEPDPLGMPLESFDGFAVDHTWAESKEPSLVTVFSAPNYPQHDPQFHCPVASVLVLQGPDYGKLDDSSVSRFRAAPRPEGKPFYDTNQAGSEEGLPGGDDVDGQEEEGEEVTS